MKRISYEEIAREIWVGSHEYFVSQMAVQHWNETRYTFARFKNDMLRHETIVCVRTMRDKWDMMQAKGLIRQTGRRPYDDASINLWALAPYMSASAQALLRGTGPSPVGYMTSILEGRESDTHTYAEVSE